MNKQKDDYTQGSSQRHVNHMTTATEVNLDLPNMLKTMLNSGKSVQDICDILRTVIQTSMSGQFPDQWKSDWVKKIGKIASIAKGEESIHTQTLLEEHLIQLSNEAYQFVGVRFSFFNESHRRKKEKTKKYLLIEDENFYAKIPEDSFFFREKIINELPDFSYLIKNEKISYLIFYGMPGVGKSFLANYVFHKYKHCFSFSGWFCSETQQKLEQDYRKILSVNHAHSDSVETNQLIKSFHDHLTHFPHWLLVYDNPMFYDDAGNTWPEKNMFIDSEIEYEYNLMPFLPKEGSGLIVITAHHNRWPSDYLFPVGDLEPEEAPKFIKQFCGRVNDIEKASELGKLLDYLPLALAQASAYIKETGINIQGYMDRYQDENQKSICLNLLKDEKRPIHHRHKTIAKTFEIAMIRIQSKDSLAIEVTYYSSFLSADAIPRILLYNLIRRDHSSFSINDLDNCLALLYKFGLIRYIGSESISMHRLLQTVIRLSLSELEKNRIVENITIEINQNIHFDRVESTRLDTSYFHHALILAACAKNLSFNRNALANLMTNIGAYCTHHLRSPAHARKYLEVAESYLDINSDLSPNLYTHIGFCEYLDANYKKSWEYSQKAYEIYEKLGKETIEKAYNLRLIGYLYEDDLDDLDSALQYMYRALAIQRKVGGQNHLDVATTIGSIAEILDLQGDDDQAESLYRSALEIICKTSSKQPNLILGYCRLGNIYCKRGFHCYERSSRILILPQDMTLPKDEALKYETIYLKTLNDGLNVEACWYKGEKEHKKDIELKILKQLSPIFYKLKSTTEIHKKDNQELVEKIISLISYTFYEKALNEYHKALNICESIYGDSNNLRGAEVLRKMGEIKCYQKAYTEAEILLVNALKIQRDHCNDTSEDIRLTLKSLAILTYEKGELGNALTKFNEILELEKKCLKNWNNDLYVMETYLYIGKIYCKLGKYLESKMNVELSLEILKKCAIAHPSIIECNNLLKKIEVLSNQNDEQAYLRIKNN